MNSIFHVENLFHPSQNRLGVNYIIRTDQSFRNLSLPTQFTKLRIWILVQELTTFSVTSSENLDQVYRNSIFNCNDSRIWSKLNPQKNSHLILAKMQTILYCSLLYHDDQMVDLKKTIRYPFFKKERWLMQSIFYRP